MITEELITKALFDSQYELNLLKLRYHRLGQREMLSREGSEIREKITRCDERISTLTWVLGFNDKEE